MFTELPESLQKEVLYYLQSDNFRKAKAIHDAWLENQADYPSLKEQERN